MYTNPRLVICTVRLAFREEEAAEKQKEAVAHVVENLFPYAPVTVQTQSIRAPAPKLARLTSGSLWMRQRSSEEEVELVLSATL